LTLFPGPCHLWGPPPMKPPADPTVTRPQTPGPAIIYLRYTTPWFGNQSGYERLPRYISGGYDPLVIDPKPGILPRLRGKLFSFRHGIGHAPQAVIDAIRRFVSAMRSSPGAVGHVLYGEHILPYVDAIPESMLGRLIWTFHQPYSLWNPTELKALGRVRSSIFLYKQEEHLFRAHLPSAPHFIPYGVNCDFFRPGPGPEAGQRVLYAGVHLRDVHMVAATVALCWKRNPNLRFSFLVPTHRRSDAGFEPLLQDPRISWLAGLGDEALVRLYQTSSLLYLPLINSSSNTAVVESLGCGLPIVTTDVGGIRDYGGGEIHRLVRAGDAEAAAGEILALQDDLEERRRIGIAARAFAEKRLHWPIVAAAHERVYFPS